MNKEKVEQMLTNIDKNAELVEQFLRGMNTIKSPNMDLEKAITRLFDIKGTYTEIIRKEIALLSN